MTWLVRGWKEVVTSDNTNRVARRGPSWAPPAAAQSPAPSVAGDAALGVAPRAEQRVPLRVADGARRQEPPPTPPGAESEPPPLPEEGVASWGPSPATVPEAAPPPPPAAAPPELAVGPRHSGEIDRDMLLRPARRRPQSGWRRVVYGLTGGLVNPGESAEDIRRRQLVERVNQPIRGVYRIAMVSLKGGVGKTTATVGVGSTFASLRGDHVVAVDANPDRGTLGGRIPTQTTATVRDLLNDAENIHRYSDVRAFTSQGPSRLEVLASERDPHKAEAFSRDDYRTALGVLESFFSLIVTDCGTGLVHGAMQGVLDTADALVLVSSPALDAAMAADATLNWLTAQGYGELVARTVVVISSASRGPQTVNIGQLVEHFAAKTRAVHTIPFDQHLAEGSEVDLDRLSAATREAFVELAALLADDFPAAAGRHHDPHLLRG